jgi:hypothetical protein
LSFLEGRGQLKQAAALIKARDMQAAQEMLRPLCEGGSADAWWLLAQTTKNPQRIQFALQKALAINPEHGRAKQQFAAQFPEATLPEAQPAAPRKAKQKQKVESSGGGAARLLIVAIGGLVIGGAGFILFRTLTYTLPPPVLGPYYQRHLYPYTRQAPSPCDSFLVFGTVKDGGGLTAHLWIREYDQQMTLDATGNFQFELPSEAIIYRGELGNHYLGDPPVRFQLLDNAGSIQSGINQLWFLRGCALYLEYWRDTSGGLKMGNPALRPTSWQGPYQVAYSALTTSPLLICDFTGFTGTAYDDNGPMRDIAIQISDVDNPSSPPQYWVTDSGSLEAQMGPSGWYLFAKPDNRYLLQVVSPSGVIIISDVVYLPPKEGCEGNLIKVSITQAENRNGTEPPPLPADWQE